MATSSSVKTTTYETRTSYESDTTGTTPVYRATMTPRNLIIQRTYAGPSGSSSVSRSERLFSLIGVIFPGYEGYAYTPLFKVGGTVKGKGKVFPYSLPSVRPGADPGVQAVSPQVHDVK